MESAPLDPKDLWEGLLKGSLVCSHGVMNDLLEPFRWRFQGAGRGSLFCLKAVEHPGSPDPGEDNLGEFRLIWGDRWKEEGED